MEAQTIHLSDHYRINYVASNEVEQIVFSFMNMTELEEKNLNDFEPLTGFGTRFLQKFQVGVVEIIPRYNEWYQKFGDLCINDIELFLSSQGISNKRRLGYGSSMGGYGAVAYAEDLQLARVFALSPQYEIDQTYDKRWEKYVSSPLSKRIVQAGPAAGDIRFIIAYDPHNPDKLQADGIVNALNENITPVRMPFSGHPVGHALSYCKQLTSITESWLINGDPPPDVIYARRSPQYLLSRALFLDKAGRHKRAALYMAIRGKYLDTTRGVHLKNHYLFSSRIYLRAGLITEALQAVNVALDMVNSDHACLYQLKKVEEHLASSRNASAPVVKFKKDSNLPR